MLKLGAAACAWFHTIEADKALEISAPPSLGDAPVRRVFFKIKACNSLVDGAVVSSSLGPLWLQIRIWGDSKMGASWVDSSLEGGLGLVFGIVVGLRGCLFASAGRAPFGWSVALLRYHLIYGR